MKKILKLFLIAPIICSLVVGAINFTNANSTQSNLDKTNAFLSDVLGLDMAKYSLIDPPFKQNITHITNIASTPNETSPDTNPNERIGIDLETPSYYFKSKSGTIDVMSCFYDGKLSSVNINPLENECKYIYANSPGTDLKTQTNSILSKYATLLSKQATEASFLTPMNSMLSTIDFQKPTNLTIGNINFQLTIDGNKTNLQWFYTENTPITNYKRVELDFNNGQLESFADSWSLYKISSLNTLTEKQARAIALDAAQKITLKFENAKGETLKVDAPDLTSAPLQIQLGMFPIYNLRSNLPDGAFIDPYALYPVWSFSFSFNETIIDVDGIQGGILGDTSQVLYVQPYGHLGILPSNSAVEPTDTTNSVNSSGIWIGIVIIVTLVLIICVPIAFRKKIHRS